MGIGTVGKVQGPPTGGGPELLEGAPSSRQKNNRFVRFWVVNCTKMRLAAGLRPGPLGEL